MAPPGHWISALSKTFQNFQLQKKKNITNKKCCLTPVPVWALHFHAHSFLSYSCFKDSSVLMLQDCFPPVDDVGGDPGLGVWIFFEISSGCKFRELK